MPKVWEGLVLKHISFSDAVSLGLTDTGDVVAWQTKEVGFRGKGSKKYQKPVVIKDWQNKGVIQVYAGEEEGDYASKGRIFAISNLGGWQKEILTVGAKLLSADGCSVAHRAAQSDNPYVFQIIANIPQSLKSLEMEPLLEAANRILAVTVALCTTFSCNCYCA